jgi:hypothetical protein
VPLHTLCTSNVVLSSRNSVGVHRCESASRLVLVRAWLKKDITRLIHEVILKSYNVTDFLIQIDRSIDERIGDNCGN